MTRSELEHLADHILMAIRSRPKQFFTYTSLAKKLASEPSMIEAAVRCLIDWGYRVRRRRREAVSFLEAPDTLTTVEIQHGLKTKLIGSRVHCYRLVKSTNDLAAQLAENGAPEGTIVTSEEQSAGRGRLGRLWHSPAGTGIYVSIVLLPKFLPDRAPGLSIMTALALATVLEEYCPGDVRIKWPNDLLVSGKKCAGILTELSAERNRINHVVVGVGINVNQQGVDFPPELRTVATSLRRCTKRKVNRVSLLKEFLKQLEKEYRLYQKIGLAKSQKRLRKYSALLGRKVKLVTGAHEVSGTAVDIDTNGALIIESNGKRVPVAAGEVTVAKD